MPSIETYRKQAKLLVRWHRERSYSIGEKLRLLERYRHLTDAEVRREPPAAGVRWKWLAQKSLRSAAGVSKNISGRAVQPGRTSKTSVEPAEYAHRSPRRRDEPLVRPKEHSNTNRRSGTTDRNLRTRAKRARTTARTPKTPDERPVQRQDIRNYERATRYNRQGPPKRQTTHRIDGEESKSEQGDGSHFRLRNDGAKIMSGPGPG